MDFSLPRSEMFSFCAVLAMFFSDLLNTLFSVKRRLFFYKAALHN